MSTQTRSKPRATTKKRRRARGVATGTLVRIDADGSLMIRLSRSTREHAAQSIVALSAADVGREVVLGFDRGRLDRPIVLGCIRAASMTVDPQVKVSLDGETIVLQADREISLRCGKSSITLTRAGKVLIRGAYLLSRSSGANRIKGGSVQIN